MEYGMVGDDGLTMEERLTKYAGRTEWTHLRAACMYNVLYFVDSSLNLNFVAKAFLEDKASQIQSWLQAGDLVKLDKLHLDYFDQDKTKSFEATVVSPFVLCQEPTD